MTVSNCLFDPPVSFLLRYFSLIDIYIYSRVYLRQSLFFYFSLNFKFFFDMGISPFELNSQQVISNCIGLKGVKREETLQYHSR